MTSGNFYKLAGYNSPQPVKGTIETPVENGIKLNLNLFSMKKITEVLLIDDDQDEHYFIKQAFKDVDAAVAVTSVYNGFEGLQYLLKLGKYRYSGRQLPDVIISDMNMPLMNGSQFLKEVKILPQLQDIPFFLFSTSPDDAVKEECLNNGALQVYTKPMHLNDFKIILRDILFQSSIRLVDTEPPTRNTA
jgi:CheY-like chemotaxis protein